MADSAAYDRLIDALRAAGKTVRHDSDTKAMAQCPAHPDRNPSLRLTAVPGKVLVYCHAGCDTETHVLPALSLTWADLFDTRGGIKIDTGIRAESQRKRRHSRSDQLRSPDSLPFSGSGLPIPLNGSLWISAMRRTIWRAVLRSEASQNRKSSQASGSKWMLLTPRRQRRQRRHTRLPRGICCGVAGRTKAEPLNAN